MYFHHLEVHLSQTNRRVNCFCQGEDLWHFISLCEQCNLKIKQKDELSVHMDLIMKTSFKLRNIFRSKKTFIKVKKQV